MRGQSLVDVEKRRGEKIGLGVDVPGLSCAGRPGSAAFRVGSSNHVVVCRLSGEVEVLWGKRIFVLVGLITRKELVPQRVQAKGGDSTRKSR